MKLIIGREKLVNKGLIFRGNHKLEGGFFMRKSKLLTTCMLGLFMGTALLSGCGSSTTKAPVAGEKKKLY